MKAKLIKLLETHPLRISSTRRGGNGLRNAEELADAIEQLYKVNNITWAGDDIDECHEIVKNTRSDAGSRADLCGKREL